MENINKTSSSAASASTVESKLEAALQGILLVVLFYKPD